MQKLKSINRQQKLYVIPCGNGYTCLGFDVCHRRTTRLAEWLRRPELMPPPRKGTRKAWAAYQAAMQAAQATGTKCPVELTPQLVGKEGRRVEVKHPDGETSRFWVGQSAGWLPVHLEIKTRRSLGGCAVYLPEGSTVRIIA